MEAPLRLQVCGVLAIEAAGIELREDALPGRLGRRLWAYLAVNRNRPVARDEVATALWGDEIPDAWDASLNATASRVRSALRPILAVAGGLVLRGEAGRYTLSVPDDAFVDIDRAWRGLLRMEAALRSRDFAGAAAEGLIARSIARRGFLVGEGGGWVEAQRRALWDTHMQATELSAEAELARRELGEALRIARELVGLDSLRESGYRLLMRAYGAKGDRAEAVHVMEECRARLRASGLDPSPETERVFRETVGADAAHDAR